jgi:RNA polymerase sigma-70 factor (ECF subfamily)
LSNIDREIDQIRAAQQDPRAFAPLYEAYVGMVWRFAMSRLGDTERAADVTSMTFSKALRALPDFQPQRRSEGTTFPVWLMTIARNTLVSDVRHDRVAIRIDHLDKSIELPDSAPSPEEQALKRMERERVQAALDQLSTTQRQIVELRLAGMKAFEIGSLLEMSVSAVNTAHFRAYARLRELLAEPTERKRERHVPTS